MKPRKTLNFIIGLFPCTSFFFLSSGSQAHPSDFFCELRQGIPVTIYRSESGNKPIIRWVSTNLPNNLTPQKRCEMVSEKFQAALDHQLLYFATGSRNGQPVMCASDRVGGGCLDVLFTFNPGSDPKKILTQLLDLRGLANGNAIEQGDDKQVYINFMDYVRRIPPESN